MQSPDLQRNIDPPRTGREGDVGAAQALVGPSPLAWVPDIVGRSWRSPDAVLVFGASYADFFSPFARRRRVMTLKDCLAENVATFQPRFACRVMEGDTAYYDKVRELLRGAGVPVSHIVLTDLCRASFVAIQGGRAVASEQVLRSNADTFTTYVSANRRWHLRRIDDAQARVIVALGRLAARGVIHLLKGAGWSRQGRRVAGQPKTSWVLGPGPHQTETPLISGTGRRLTVLHVPHPGARGAARPADGAPALRRLLGRSPSELADPRRTRSKSTDQPRTDSPGAGRSGVVSPADHDALWRELFLPARPLPAADLLAQHPRANHLTRELLDGVSAPRVVAIANAMFNPCRPSRLASTGTADARSAWSILLERKDAPFDRRGTKWERLLVALSPMPDWAKARVQRMNIRSLGSLAQALIRGPYRRM